MKKLVLFLLLPVSMLAQDMWLAQNIGLTDADSSHAEATISGKAFELMSYAQPDSILTEDMLQLAKSVEGMMGYLALSPATTDALFAKLESNSTFEEYTKVQRKDEKMALYVDAKDGVVRETIMVVKSADQNMAMSVYGELDMRLFGELYKLIPYRYMQDLQSKNPQGDEK